MNTNVKKISKEALEYVIGGSCVPWYLYRPIPDVLCDDCDDDEMLYISEYYEDEDIAVINCSRCGEGFYWDYKIDDYGSPSFLH